MKLHRLLGGSATAALARTAAQVEVEDDSVQPAVVPAPGPEDEDEDEQRPAAEAPATPAASSEQPAPAAAAPPASASAEQELSPAEVAAFNAGTAARNEDIATVFSTRATKADGTEGDLLVAGREAAAAELIAGGLSADATIKMLGKLPKGTAGDAMLANLRENASQTPALSPGGESDPNAAAKGPWAKAAKKLGWDKPETK